MTLEYAPDIDGNSGFGASSNGLAARQQFVGLSSATFGAVAMTYTAYTAQNRGDLPARRSTRSANAAPPTAASTTSRPASRTTAATASAAVSRPIRSTPICSTRFVRMCKRRPSAPPGTTASCLLPFTRTPIYPPTKRWFSMAGRPRHRSAPRCMRPMSGQITTATASPLAPMGVHHSPAPGTSKTRPSWWVSTTPSEGVRLSRNSTGVLPFV